MILYFTYVYMYLTKGRELYLQASSDKGINDYIVWKSETGDAFLIHLHNPKGEEASDFAGLVLVSLSTVQSDS